MQTINGASVAWIAHHIETLWPDEQLPEQVAEALVAKADREGKTVEELIEWLHEHHAQRRELSVRAFNAR